MWNLNAITPETGKTAHYFYAQAYNFKLEERWVADTLHERRGRRGSGLARTCGACCPT